VTLNAAPTDLTGKVALVTGASGGIGASAVAHFAALGATVYATDISLI
jgi:D-sorbitol dehydrogenase (acceptor)